MMPRVGIVSLAFIVGAGCGGAATRAGEPAAKVDTLDCSRTGELSIEGSAVSVTLTDADLRHDADSDQVSALRSSLRNPVEVCGLDGQLAMLTSLRCDDGSAPFADTDEADAARLGPAEMGGRCGHPVVVYEVVCPDATYRVHSDLYVCLASEVDAVVVPVKTVIAGGFSVDVPGGWYLTNAWPEPLAVAMSAGEGRTLAIASGDDLATAQAVASRHLGGSALPELVVDGPAVTGDGSLVAIATSAGDEVRVAATTDSSLRKTLPGLARSLRKNDRSYMDAAGAVARARASGPMTVTELELGGRSAHVPAGWEPQLAAASITARTDDGLLFMRASLGAELGGTDLWVAAVNAALGISGQITVWHHEWREPGRDLRYVVSSSSQVMALSYRNEGGATIAYVVSGPLRGLSVDQSFAWLELLVSAWTGEPLAPPAATAEPTAAAPTPTAAP